MNKPGGRRLLPGWREVRGIYRKYFNTFITKFLLYAPVGGLILPLFGGVPPTTALLAATVAALASFLTADLVVLPKYGNIPALLADLVVTAVVLLEFSYLYNFRAPIPAVILALALIVAGEMYYHRYLVNILFARRRR